MAGTPSGVAYAQVFKAKDRSVADVCATQMLSRPRVKAYIGAMRDQSVAAVVLSQEVLHGHAMVIARGGPDIGPAMQLEAIRYLDACLHRNRTICINGLTVHGDANERMVAGIAFAALEAEAKGTIGADDARHLIASCALVQQIMHGATIAEDMTGGTQPQQPLRVSNGHGNGGNGSTIEL